jgi:hypothetical protein
MDDIFAEDYGEFVEDARNPLSPLGDRKACADLLLEDDSATPKLDLETLVICRLLRAQAHDFSDLLYGTATKNKRRELRRILHNVALTEEETDILVGALDILSFCGSSDSINSLLLVIERDESTGNRAANAAIDALSVLAVNARPKEVEVFIKRVQAAKSRKEISRHYGKPIERIMAALQQKRKCPNTNELMRWVSKNKPRLSESIEGPKRRMRAKQVPLKKAR